MSRSRQRRLCGVAVIALVALLTGCGARLAPDLVTATAPDGRGALRPLPAPAGCTTTVTDAEQLNADLAAAVPGSRICVLGNLDTTRMIMDRSGTASAPIEVLGDGNTVVRGITVTGNNVTISGINAVYPHAPGVSLHGNNITLVNSTVISPRHDDGDGIRFFGNNITIAHNTIRDTRDLNFAHADCMQTYATDEEDVASQHVRIEDNRCEKIDNMCLMAEGPNSEAGDGSGVGVSDDFRFVDNDCDNHASQSTEMDDVQNTIFTDNNLLGQKDKAFSFQNKATGAIVEGNVIATEIDHQVGMDRSSMRNYRGPAPLGGP